MRLAGNVSRMPDETHSPRESALSQSLAVRGVRKNAGGLGILTPLLD
ncbi:MAG: hypothetical protein ACI8W8_003954 [Rhodothermales bacterium]|jgi:hypothetical protein